MTALKSSFLSILVPIAAFGAVKGEVRTFKSPHGLTEECIAPAEIPGGVFSKKDKKAEAELCSYDIYDQSVAICPKTWSTSPGTILYSTEGTNLSQADFENKRCAFEVRKQNEKFTKFKNSMNQSGTSATYSQASLLYYQLSRYFDTFLDVPVSVYRSIDKDVHLARVSSRAKGQGAMNRTAWQVEVNAEKNPATYKPTTELFTPDLKQIYGVLIDELGGPRYGAEVNGIRTPGMTAQNVDFLNTPGFQALRSEQPFAAAVQAGIKAAKALPKLNADLGSMAITPVQVGLWMKELTEVTLLDYIFAQQDRIGNINYEWVWVYRDGNELKTQKEKRKEFKKLSRKAMKAIAPPDDIAGFHPELIQKSVMNDNDAGARNYRNMTADPKVQMVEKIRHYDLATYRKLLALNADLQNHGAIFSYLRDNLNLTDANVQAIVKNTKAVTAILVKTCQAGKLRFDLDVDGIVSGQVQELNVANCGNP